MKNKFSSVAFLLVVIIVFINVLQFFWVFHSYRSTKKQYQEILNQSLRSAALDYTQWKAEEYEKYIKKNTEVIVVPPKKRSEEAKTKTNSQTVTTNGDQTTITRTKYGAEKFNATVKVLPDQYRRLYNIENRDPYAFNTKVFHSFFKRQLARQEIKASFIVDTFHIKNELANIDRNTAARKGYPVQTEAIHLNVFSKIAVSASVKNYPQFVLKNILFILILSVLAIVVANVFLFHILRRISKEKKSREIRDDFISNITHEIKTPIAVITSAVDTLLFHTGLDNKEKVIKYLHTSKKEIEHLNNMVDKLMDTALDKEITIDHRTSIDITDLITNIHDKYRLLYGSEVTINYKSLENTKKVFIDQLHFANAINNIVENAIKYSNAPVVIEITSTVTDNECVITIADNGVGIHPKYHDIVFEKFFRVPDSSYKQGYGLGLYYTKKVVESHKGEISFQSTVGTGTKFIIKIPVE